MKHHGKSLRQVANELGVSSKMLRKKRAGQPHEVTSLIYVLVVDVHDQVSYRTFGVVNS